MFDSSCRLIGLQAMGYFTEVGIGAPEPALEDAKRWYWRAACMSMPLLIFVLG